MSAYELLDKAKLGIPATQSELERSAIDDAYQEAVRTEFANLIESLIPVGTTKPDESGPVDRMKCGLSLIRRARELALQVIGG